MNRASRVLVVWVLLVAAGGAPRAQAFDSGQLPAPLPGSSAFDPDLPAAPAVGGAFQGAAQPSSALDLHQFLHQFDAQELLREMRGELLGGAQAAVSNYLLALAYSSPAIASVLDMADHKYATRFQSLASARAAQGGAAGAGADPGSRLQMAQEQCLARLLGQSVAPTAAWRRCAVDHDFPGDLSATRSNTEFLRSASAKSLPPETEALLALLPDERVQGGALQAQAPRLTLAALSRRVQQRARAALARIAQGDAPSRLARCEAGTLASESAAPAACLPAQSLAIVQSGSWGALRLLPESTRSSLLDTFSEQVASTASLDAVLELAQRVSGFEPAPGVDAGEMRARMQGLHQQIGQLFAQAQMQAALTGQRLRLAQTQSQALHALEQDLDRQASAAAARARAPGLDGQSALPLLP